ncbi:unnamed protein product, partial [Staurois parvus]
MVVGSGTFFIGFFEFGQGHGPHDPLLPGGPMSCQSAPGHDTSYVNPLCCVHIYCSIYIS